jgi:hypothetical protein
VAAGVDLRLPTGDPRNLLGSGTTGVQPFAIWSGTLATVSPHANVSYTWNGSSVLAGDPATGQSADFPDELRYAAGAEVAMSQRVTLALDLAGRTVIGSERLLSSTFHAQDGTSTFPNITFQRDTFNLLNGAIGTKINVAGRVLAEVNVLFALDDHGLRDRVTPLLGLQYTF